MLKRLSVILIVGLVCFSVNAQCKRFTKKKCFSELGEYVFNGQLNTVVLSSGEEAELRLSFYSKQGYRIYTCAEEQLGDVDFEIMDTDRNILYKSKENGSKIFDFKVPSTQQLIVRVIVVREKTEHALDFQGCVSVLVGFLEE